jgi:hypothetical protein
MNMFVGGAVLAASATAIPTLTDRALIEMEEKIFEHKEAAEEINSELDRLGAIWRGEQQRLYEAAVAAGNVVETEDQRLEQVGAMPEHIEHGRLIDLQGTHWYAADELVAGCGHSQPKHLKAGAPSFSFC